MLQIPKSIHQTFPTKQLPPHLSDNPSQLQERNPGWSYQLYDDQDILDFIGSVYGNDTLDVYLKIDPAYGAARADFFRYLLMYERGGVYLDIKSMATRPLGDVLTLDESFVLSRWRNKPGEEFEGSGMHPELAAFPGGELQQWFIICEPRHPYLAAVIDTVTRNVLNYRAWKGGVGRTGVLRVTGPIAYTKAIEPIKTMHRHVQINTHDDIGLRYNAFGTLDHRVFFKSHYTRMDTAIVQPTGMVGMAGDAYLAVRRVKNRLITPKHLRGKKRP